MKFNKKVLKNGITVVHESRELPVISLGISNPFGASHEAAKIKGIAHFIEHLLFTGTQTRTHEDISREIEKKGGVLNAFTSHDVTSYWFKLPAEHLFSGLDILTDMLKNPKFEPEKFEKEKKVILEEIKMYHDIPQYHVFEQLLENLYESPFGNGIIGSKETVSALTRDFVHDYFAKKYSPENYIVTLVGKADFKKVCDYLEKHFSPKNKVSKNIPLKKHSAETVEERPGIDQAHFTFAFHAPPADHPDLMALEVLDAYIANGMSSRLFLEIREKRGLAYSVKSSFNVEKNYSYYSIYVGTTKEAIPEVKRLILQEFQDAEKMTAKDLNEAKERIIGLRRIQSEESANVMNELLFAELSEGKAENYYSHDKEIEKVSLEDVKRMARIKNYSTASIVPK
jgi:predicted Zn-dependent peptidase